MENKILSRDWSAEFIKLMQNRIEVSHYKYGWMSKTYPELAQAVKQIEPRLQKYIETGNREWLVDIANFAMIEFMYPSIAGAHFKGTDSNESPGLVDGISYNELKAELEDKHDNN